jgi:23S rRNA (adenine2503-C2)-methyltransferase
MEGLGWGERGLVGPVGRTHASESGEGVVLKFTQVVARAGERGAAGGGTARPAELARELPVLGQGGGGGGAGGLETESVLIPMVGKRRVLAYTLCVSSQVGCAMGCTFCQTAQMGLVRSLSCAEIVGQWFAARHLVRRPDAGAELRNIVFMGMGEPMDNLAEVLAAVEVLTDRRGPGVAMSRVTISTVGRVDGIEKLASHVRAPGWHRLGLAISVNAPSDAARSRIMPVNRAMPLGRLRAALERYPLWASRHLMLEYVLIPGENDGPEHADMMASFVLGSSTRAEAEAAGLPYCELPEGAWLPRYEGPRLAACVNVIPYNPRESSPWPAPSEESVEAFCGRLSGYGVYVKRRRTKGRDQMAACGQLGNLAYRRVRGVAGRGVDRTGVDAGVSEHG